MKLVFPQDFSFFPKSWEVPLQIQQLKADMNDIKEKATAEGKPAPMFIVKPSDMA